MNIILRCHRWLLLHLSKLPHILCEMHTRGMFVYIHMCTHVYSLRLTVLRSYVQVMTFYIMNLCILFLFCMCFSSECFWRFHYTWYCELEKKLLIKDDQSNIYAIWTGVTNGSGVHGSHYSDVTWSSWRLRSLSNQLFFQQLLQAN